MCVCVCVWEGAHVARPRAQLGQYTQSASGWRQPGETLGKSVGDKPTGAPSMTPLQPTDIGSGLQSLICGVRAVTAAVTQGSPQHSAAGGAADSRILERLSNSLSNNPGSPPPPTQTSRAHCSAVTRATAAPVPLQGSLLLYRTAPATFGQQFQKTAMESCVHDTGETKSNFLHSSFSRLVRSAASWDIISPS